MIELKTCFYCQKNTGESSTEDLFLCRKCIESMACSRCFRNLKGGRYVNGLCHECINDYQYICGVCNGIFQKSETSRSSPYDGKCVCKRCQRVKELEQHAKRKRIPYSHDIECIYSWTFDEYYFDHDNLFDDLYDSGLTWEEGCFVKCVPQWPEVEELHHLMANHNHMCEDDDRDLVIDYDKIENAITALNKTIQECVVPLYFYGSDSYAVEEPLGNYLND